MPAIKLFAFLLVLITGCPNLLYSQNFEQEIDQIFESWNSSDKPGGVVTVVLEGEVIYKKAFGPADISVSKPNELATPFELASVAKQFTATCIALLAEQNMLSLEDRLSKYYTQFQFGDKVKIKHLINHSSGIREAYVLAVLAGQVNLLGEVPKRFQTKERLFGLLSQDSDLNFEPGTEFAYTNINYILLGDIVEKVSNQSLREFADSAIFKPLNMQNTFFNDEDINYQTVGYYYNGKGFKKKKAMGGIVGDHNLISTAGDLVQWTNNFTHNRLGNKDPKFNEILFTNSTLSDGSFSNYGYGFNIRDYNGFKQVGHGGDNGIQTSRILTIPEEKLAIICLANSSRYYDTSTKAEEIRDLLLDVDDPDNSIDIIAPFQLPTEQLESMQGLYHVVRKNGLTSFRKISYEDGSLYTSDSYYHRGLKMQAIDSNYFVAKNPSNKYLHLRFRKDSIGRWVMHEIYEDLVDMEVVQFKPSTFDQREYLGKYSNDDLGTVLKLKRKGDTLKAKKGILGIPLLQIDHDLFYAIQNDATFSFQRDESGQISGLKLNAIDFRNFHLEKRK